MLFFKRNTPVELILPWHWITCQWRITSDHSLAPADAGRRRHAPQSLPPRKRGGCGGDAHGAAVAGPVQWGCFFNDKNPEKTDAGAGLDGVEGLGLQDAVTESQKEVLHHV